MGQIDEAAALVYEDGPTAGPSQPDKGLIRNLFALIQSIIDGLISLFATSTQWKDPVRVAATGNVNISTGLENGDTLDGVTLVTGNRVGLTAQTNAAQNGIYVVPASGAASRATDADSAAEVLGMAFFVEEGDTNGGKQFVCTAVNPITLGTTDLPFKKINAGPGFDPDSLIAETFDGAVEVDGDTVDESLEVLLNDPADPLTFKKIDLTELANAMIGRRPYPNTIAATVGTTTTMVLDAEPTRTDLKLYNASATATIIVNILGGEPIANTSGCYTLEPGQGYDYIGVSAPQCPVNAKATEAGAQLMVTVASTSGVDPMFDLMTAEWSTKPDAAKRLLLGKFMGDIRRIGALDSFDFFANALVPTQTAFLSNWANPLGTKFTVAGSPVFTPYTSIAGNASDAAIDTGIDTPTGYTGQVTKATLDKHFMFAIVGNLNGYASGKWTMGGHTFGLQANRLTNSLGVRSGDNVSDTLTSITYSHYTHVLRRTTTGYTARTGTTDNARVISSSPTEASTRFKLFGLNSSAGSMGSTFTDQPIVMAGLGKDMTDAMVDEFQTKALALCSDLGVF